jgi:AcrR family transcriptional regulator
MPAGRARQRVSDTAQAPTRFAAQRLSREEIVAAAVATADRDGVDAVSMRRCTGTSPTASSCWI